MPTLTGRAPAKVNLTLRVLNRRPDGFHELRTVLQTIALADRLKVTYRPRARSRVELSCNRPELAGDDNLAARAARRLLEAGKWPGAVEIDLEKRIPAGAGLGGGSSDAAAVLLALGKMLRPRPSRAALCEAAAELGSDVPFFLVGGRCVGVGRGEEVYPLPDPPRRWVVVLAPHQPVSTAQAYAALSESRRAALTPQAARNIINSFYASIGAPHRNEKERRFAEAPPDLFANDFEQVIFRQRPELALWKDRLARSGADAAMLSGSGPAIFGWFADRGRAQAATETLSAFPGSVWAGPSLSRRACQAVWGD